MSHVSCHHTNNQRSVQSEQSDFGYIVLTNGWLKSFRCISCPWRQMKRLLRAVGLPGFPWCAQLAGSSAKRHYWSVFVTPKGKKKILPASAWYFLPLPFLYFLFLSFLIIFFLFSKDIVPDFPTSM